MFGTMLWLAVAAQGPVPPKLIRSRTPEYPRMLANRNVDGFARAQITAAPSGKVIRCEVVVESGARELDEALCAAYAVAKARPARDADGQPAYGTFTHSIVYRIGDRSVTTPPMADMSLAVNRLPPGSDPFVRREAALSVSATGEVVGCHNLRKEGTPDPLDKALCDVATTRLSLKPALDEQGKPVPSIQQFVVEFSEPDAPLVRDDKFRRPL
ncbi:TonB family protein [Sphingomonas sp.]|uniref:TonB family protein n=1 Tax=Sphingomonas sp. TaxID=28214 RepID=UPI002BA12DDB|nr:TonB family protein [Sphingomonas sp.]HTG39122.1 TonB family protein [Sphingomonas sp.]